MAKATAAAWVKFMHCNLWRAVSRCVFTVPKVDFKIIGNLLIGFATRRPKQTLLFSIRQMDRKGGQFEIDMRRGMDKDGQKFKVLHIGGFVSLPFVLRQVAGE